ncbi:carboxylesterase/lipase family protein [uncultured Paludibaculum sp.]|uniref:carboxylesterase/lipase family protein n=1 Tax=uncultured Paludibaculum sp. TaxID=1765020 RepID=UPI002AAB819B|nr:carboxylesterase/lipase family protein [uncultured Paludibaculum sp.]
MRISILASLLPLVLLTATAADRVRTASGTVEGAPGTNPAIRTFKGVPFAAPPVGDLRWKAPQPSPKWKGARPATAFGARCMQAPIYSDMIFRDPGPSEDCLTLNIWTPAKSAKEKLPVMVWVYGGGFQAGGTSEPRQDGEVLATKGVIVVSMNYRMGIFGFFAHPELTKESGHNASGNYGLMDQAEALRWVKQNIKAFGGDPNNITIFGESAGSFSVSALMSSPLSRDLMTRAIGESGAFFGSTLGARNLEQSEQAGVKFAATQKAESLAALRAIPADKLLDATKANRGDFRPNIDGYYFPTAAADIYAAGKQAHIPLLAGWNSDESPYQALMANAKEKLTVQRFTEDARTRYKDAADAFLKVYTATSDEDALKSARALGGDMFIAYGTWRWINAHARTSGSPVYQYVFDRVRPPLPGANMGGIPATMLGAVHASEIEYVFGALDSNKNFAWQPDDHKVSDLMRSYWTNFAKTGDPNGPGLPKWPAYNAADNQVMHLDVDAKAQPETTRGRYEFLEAQAAKQATK